MNIIPLGLDIKEELVDDIEIKEIFTIPHTNISIDECTVVSWIIMAFFLILALILTRNLKVKGKISKRQLLLECCVDKMRTFFRDIMGPSCDEFIPWLMSMALFIGASNMIGLLGFKPPTKSMQVTAVMALTSIVLVQVAGIKKIKLGGYLKSFAKPSGIMLPMNILELVIKPLSLCMRLFGNVIGAFIIMELVKSVLGVFNIGVSLALSFYFDLFDGFLQAYIFVFLTALYIQEAVE